MKEVNIKNRLYNYYIDYLIKVKKLETKNISFNEKKLFNDLVIYFSNMIE